MKYILKSSVLLLVLITGCQSVDAPQTGSDSSFMQLLDMGSGPGCLSHSASVVGLSDTDIHISGNASVHGSVVLMGGSTLQLNGNANVSDQVYSRSADSITKTGHASCTTTVSPDLGDHEQALLDFGTKLSQLTPTQEFDSISTSMDVMGQGGSNIIRVKNGISLSGKNHLTLHGTSNDQFIFVIADGGIQISGQASIEVADGASSRKVLFYLEGANSLSASGQGSIVGTYFAPQGGASFTGNGKIEGAFVANGQINISGNGTSFTPAAWCPDLKDPEPAPSPSPSVTPTPDPTPTSTPTPDPSATPTPDPSATPSPTPTSDPCSGISCGVLGV